MLLSLLWLGILLFLPGFVLLSFFKPKNIHWLEGLLYAIGLSLAFDIVVGLALNFGLPLLGFANPISTFPVTVTWAIITIVFAGLIYKYHNRLTKPYYFKFSWWGLAPLLIYLASVFFIYQMTLPTTNLMGSDIHLEFYCAKQTVLNGYWDASIPITINTCLPITLLLPMFAVLTKIDIMSIFKVVQPLIFALLPLVLYRIYRMQFGQTVAILATVFFIALPTFTMDLVQLIRQQYSMLFFALVVLLLVDCRLGAYTKSVLGVIFGVGVIISHYGLAIGFVGYMLAIIVPFVLLKMKWVQRVWKWATRQKDELPPDFSSSRRQLWIPLGFLCLFCFGFLAFYLVKAGEGAIAVYGTIPAEIVKDTLSGTITPIAQRETILQTAIGLDFVAASGLGKTWRILQYLVEVCLMVGVIRLLLRPSSFGKIRVIYFAFIMASAIILVGEYAFQTSSYGLGATRILGITLMFMSPILIYGIDGIAKGFVRGVRLINSKVKWKQWFTTLAFGCLFLPYFVFNNGIVFEIIKSEEVSYIDIPFSVGWSGSRVDITSRSTLEDVAAMEWVLDKISVEYPIYFDHHAGKLGAQYIYIYGGEFHDLCGKPKGYVFLREWNVEHQTLVRATGYGCRRSIPWDEFECDGVKTMEYVLENGTVIYDKGAKIIFVDGEK